MSATNIFKHQVLVTSILLLCLLAQSNQVQSEYNSEKFKEIVTHDRTNDNATGLTTQELLTRSGFGYENYYVIAADGYITQLVRIINFLVDRAQLKKPPVIVFHGAHIDMTAYLIASSIQHHPEKYPRTQEDGPITSSNRSLGFTLANNGYDVWLVGTRGSNAANMGHVKDYELASEQINDTTLENPPARLYSKTPEYYQYCLDDIIDYEIKPQIDKIVNITGSNEFSVFSYSLSTPITMAFLGIHQDYAERTRVYFQMGPSLYSVHFTVFDKLYFEDICPLLPTRGIGFTPLYFAEPTGRELALAQTEPMALRYTSLKFVVNTLFGPSPQYITNLERNLVGHIFMPVSFKEVQQYCQNTPSENFTKFDYGPVRNTQMYGQSEPPAYNLSYIGVQNYITITGELDGLVGGPATTQRLVEQTRSQKPIQQILAPKFNHLDLIGAVETDRYVNLPVVEILDEYSS